LPDRQELLREISELAPWHLDVEVVPGLNISDWTGIGTQESDATGRVSFINPRLYFRQQMLKVYPEGLEGRSFLDCACNCGGYSFWARELGAGKCFGFDAREHWISQARFLARHRAEADLRFEVRDLYDLPGLAQGQFDITLFKGILYHLPDPIHGLKIAADMTRELIIVNSATMNGWPDGAFASNRESRNDLMSGVHGLAWLPTGPKAIIQALEHLGFKESKVVFWDQSPGQTATFGRVEVIAARIPGLLKI
jgi:SAM-dependent methyltransferase